MIAQTVTTAVEAAEQPTIRSLGEKIDQLLAQRTGGPSTHSNRRKRARDDAGRTDGSDSANTDDDINMTADRQDDGSNNGDASEDSYDPERSLVADDGIRTEEGGTWFKPVPEERDTDLFCVVCDAYILNGQKHTLDPRTVTGMLKYVPSKREVNRSTRNNPYYNAIEQHRKGGCKLWCTTANKIHKHLNWTPFKFAVHILGKFFDAGHAKKYDWDSEDLQMEVKDTGSHETIQRIVRYRCELASLCLERMKGSPKNTRLTGEKGVAKIEGSETEQFRKVRRPFYKDVARELETLQARFVSEKINYEELETHVTARRFINDLNLAMSDFEYTNSFFEAYFPNAVDPDNATEDNPQENSTGDTTIDDATEDNPPENTNGDPTIDDAPEDNTQETTNGDPTIDDAPEDNTQETTNGDPTIDDAPEDNTQETTNGDLVIW